MINWNATKADFEIIDAIAHRACNFLAVDFQRIEMDIVACHLNGNPLDLQRLLEADTFEFAHDILGIKNHINRNTGELENCFVPRFSLQE